MTDRSGKQVSLHCPEHCVGNYGARATRRSDCGGWPNARIKARRIRSGSRKPVSCAMRSIVSPEDCTRWRATSIRNRCGARRGRRNCQHNVPASATIRCRSAPMTKIPATENSSIGRRAGPEPYAPLLTRRTSRGCTLGHAVFGMGQKRHFGSAQSPAV